jgi:secondary thiamine-phosphate synthase enzyme
MSRSSTVTVRRQPVGSATSGSGSLHVHADMLTIQTDDRVHIVDLTDPVMEFVHRSGVAEGSLAVFSMHTTCAVFINEFQAALVADMQTFIEQLIPRAAAWLHNDPLHSDCDRTNADAHLRALVLGHSLSLQVSGGEVVLGQWQRILLAELDGPRERTIRLCAMGLA